MKTVYIASPYTADVPVGKKVRKSSEFDWIGRYKYTAYIVSCLMLEEPDKFFYSHILHFRPIALANDLPHDNEYWWKNNKHALDNFADEVYVLMLPGWDLSVGVEEEIKYASDLNKIVTFINVEQYGITGCNSIG